MVSWISVAGDLGEKKTGSGWVSASHAKGILGGQAGRKSGKTETGFNAEAQRRGDAKKRARKIRCDRQGGRGRNGTAQRTIPTLERSLRDGGGNAGWRMAGKFGRRQEFRGCGDRLSPPRWTVAPRRGEWRSSHGRIIPAAQLFSTLMRAKAPRSEDFARRGAGAGGRVNFVAAVG